MAAMDLGHANYHILVLEDPGMVRQPALAIAVP